jgi:hypothetical protein
VSDRKVVLNPGRTLRTVTAHDAIASNKHLWHHPLSLLRLALFVRDCDDVIRRAAGRRARPPLAFLGPAGEDGYCCVAGLRAKVDPEAPHQVGGGGVG